jgi:hypothetical protein
VRHLDGLPVEGPVVSLRGLKSMLDGFVGPVEGEEGRGGLGQNGHRVVSRD